MIIYFEGPDGSGKSTLLTAIYNDLINKGYSVDPQANRFIPTHPKAEHRVSSQQLFRALKKMAKDDSKVYLIDRGPISDFLYRVFDEYDWVTTPRQFIDFVNIYGFKIFTIYCRTDKAYEQMLARGDDNPVAIARHMELTNMFDLFMNSFEHMASCYFYKFDYSKRTSMKTAMKQVNKFVKDNYEEEKTL